MDVEKFPIPKPKTPEEIEAINKSREEYQDSAKLRARKAGADKALNKETSEEDIMDQMHQEARVEDSLKRYNKRRENLRRPRRPIKGSDGFHYGESK